MKPFQNFAGVVAPLDRPNVDTDQIIPKQFLKAVGKSGLARGLFFDWRFRPDGAPEPGFVLNRAPYDRATILVAGANFGCGSSREHAVWALADFGFRAVVAPSFADIFRNNCLKNGMLTIALAGDEVEAVFEAAKRHERYRLSVDLGKQRVADEFGWSARFEIDPFAKRCLVEGLDDVALTLVHEKEIAAYEAGHPVPYRP